MENQVYATSYLGPPWLGEFRHDTELSIGPNVADREEARRLAHKTLRPGQVLRMYDDDGVVAHFEADPETGEVYEVEAYHRYEIRYYGPQYGFARAEGPLGPILHDLDSVRRLAEDTLQPGHALEAWEDDWIIARYAADPYTGEVSRY